jgi:hypothetical protein
MKTIRYYNEADLKKLVESALVREDVRVKSVVFNVTPRMEDRGNYASGHEIECEVELDDGFRDNYGDK